MTLPRDTASAGNCFGCGAPVPLRFFCTCGKRECMKGMGEASRNLEIREWLIYEAGLRRAQELAKEHLAGDYVGFNRAIDAEAAKERG